MGGPPDQYRERYSAYDPLQMLPLRLPQLVVHGADDMTIPVERSRGYVSAARAAGDDVELIEPRPGGHRSHIDPRSASWRAEADWLSGRRPTSPRAEH